MIDAHSTGMSRDFGNAAKGQRARRNLDESIMQLDDHGQIGDANWTPDLDDANINVEIE